MFYSFEKEQVIMSHTAIRRLSTVASQYAIHFRILRHTVPVVHNDHIKHLDEPLVNCSTTSRVQTKSTKNIVSVLRIVNPNETVEDNLSYNLTVKKFLTVQKGPKSSPKSE